MRLSTCLFRLVLSGGLLFSLVHQAPAQTHLPIYTDKLLSGFEDWGWAPHTYSNTVPVYSGTYSLSVTAAPWNGVLLHHSDLNTSGYTNLSFWVHGGDSGGQLLRVSAKIGTNDSSGYELPPLPAKKWQQFILPLELIGAERKTNFQGIMFLVRGESPEGPFFLDDITLEAVPPPPQIIIREAHPPPPTAPNKSATDKPAPNKSEADKPAAGLEIWVAGALTLIAVFLAWLVFVIRRSAAPAKRAGSGLESALVTTGLNGTGRSGNGGGAEDWRQRALAAEAVASKQAQILRENLVPELAQLAKSNLVQGLASQRNSLLDTQRQAQQDLAALESRLAELQLPLRDRITVYEKRIAELEKELATRGEEMRELIRATLVLVRQRLDEERQKETADSAE